MQNKLPIGQTATADEVDGVTGNDKLNKNSLAAIGHESKRPRYSIFAMAVNGPNFYSPAGVWDLVSGGNPVHTNTTAFEAPYDFTGYASLSFTLSVGGASQTLTLVMADDFEDPAKATAKEVATKLDTMTLAASATVSADNSDKVTIASDDGSAVVLVTDTTANSILGFQESSGVYTVEPNRTDPGDGGSSFANGSGNSIEMEYEAREPIIFIGGQLFIGEITRMETFSGSGKYKALTGTTTIHIEKVGTGASEILSVDTHTHNHGPGRLGPDQDNKSILISIPGSRSQFSTNERFRFRVVPDGGGYNPSTHGLRGVSAVLWFKALHR